MTAGARHYNGGVLGEVLTAVVTPFAGDRSVNLDAFRRLCAHLVDNGSDGLVVAGTTGESPTLTDEERLELIAAGVDAVGDRATIVAGTGTYSTAHSVHLTERAHELGVDGFLVVTPYYNKPPVRGIVAHFRAIAEATDKPIVAYNIPQRVVLNLEPETLAELAEIPNVRAVKQATTDLEQARRIVADTGLALYAGNDDLLLPFLELGGAGGIFVYTHLVGRRVKDLITRFKDGDAEAAAAIDEDLRPLVEALAVTTNPIPVKAALNMLGHDVGAHRLPLVEASVQEKATIREALERAGVLEAARA
jgi:4-hydroxy-tetrahydrodipicolinate synthase